ncbi:G patch domain-containing protein 4 [Anastrepha ludens]|uniref:G patch domain-containing protein 4 n=1 Tax=Anastrepha ludens TaxID=28586 RepID=UPI0023B0ABEA|nr:G patch domain-containing protein 4 [Anastrepha ludens]
MDFARNILNKYGWKEGEGLGKNSDGIVKPLKAVMKFDNAGLGSDQAASDFNNHWWERVFNEAAGNVEVKSGKNGVSMDLKNKHDSVEISTKGYSLKKLKKAKEGRITSDAMYDNFIQSATLTKSGDERENPNKITVADISVTEYKTLTDDELFRACGGRTAHKGARHGLKLSGKLSRIEQQEQELLARMQERKKQSVGQPDEKDSKKIKRKKKSKKEEDIAGGDPDSELSKNLVATETCISVKKKPKVSQSTSEDTFKRGKNEKEEIVQLSDNASVDVDNLKQKKNKRKTKEKRPLELAATNTDLEVEECRKKSKKSKKKEQ